MAERMSLKSKVAIIGVGYVGLALTSSFLKAGISVIGLESSESRREKIKQGSFDESQAVRRLISDSLASNLFELSSDFNLMKDADYVVLCLPTPTNERHEPDFSILAEVCRQVVEFAQPNQTIILTSTSFIGTTRKFLVEPLEARGFRVGQDIFVSFSPERVDPGNVQHHHSEVDRILAGSTDSCFQKAHAFLKHAASKLHRATTLEAAEMTKLVENSFRAINIAWINEMANLAAQKGLNISEVVDLAATKPYGYMKFTPGPGAGGHCIPADPHYLLLDSTLESTPITTLAMKELHRRPLSIASQAAELLNSSTNSEPRVLVWGVAYKPNVSDVRESPALGIIEELLRRGIETDFHDPHVEEVSIKSNLLVNKSQPALGNYDLVILHTIHETGVPEEVFNSVGMVLDTTFKFSNRFGVVSPS